MKDSIEKWMTEWVRIISQANYENSFSEKSDEWVEIEGIGRFKGLEIVSEDHRDISNVTINLKYDVLDKNAVRLTKTDFEVLQK